MKNASEGSEGSEPTSLFIGNMHAEYLDEKAELPSLLSLPSPKRSLGAVPQAALEHAIFYARVL